MPGSPVGTKAKKWSADEGLLAVPEVSHFAVGKGAPVGN